MTIRGFCVRLAAALAVVVCIVFATAVSAQPFLSVDPDTLRESDGNTFTLDIVVSAGVNDLMGYDIAVTFNPDVIELIGVTEGALPQLSGYPTFFHWYGGVLATDSVHVNGAILGNTVDGPGILFSLHFKGHAVTGVASTDVIIAHSVMRTGINTGIAHDVEHGWVEVSKVIRAEVTSWGTVKWRYR